MYTCGFSTESCPTVGAVVFPLVQLDRAAGQEEEEEEDLEDETNNSLAERARKKK